jgi:hypothetical protein
MKKKDNFGKKSKKKKLKREKKHVGKVKAKFSTSSILKKKFNKDNFEKKTCG